MAEGKNKVLGLIVFLFSVTLGLVLIDAGGDVLRAGSSFAGAALGVANLGSNEGITGAVVVSESSLGLFMAAPEVADAAVSTASLNTITGMTQLSVNSCKGYCGSKSLGDCYCDSKCVRYGDCCYDYRQACSGGN